MLAAAFPGHALTASSTVRGSRGSGRRYRTYLTFEFTLLCENGPGNAGKFVGKRDRQHITVQSLFGGFDPGFKAVAFPVLCSDQEHPGGLHEQDPQIAVAALRYWTENRAISGRGLLWHHSEPGPEVAPF